jgi:GntR family transcriptional regulator
MSSPRDLPADIFHIATGSSEPIYRQMIEQLRRLVVGGQVHPGDGMPSVRMVAGSLGVNPMTVSKAYSMLEAEGLLERQRGMGMIVATRKAQVDEDQAKLELLKPSMQRLALEVQQLKLAPEPVIAMFSEMLNNEIKN